MNEQSSLSTRQTRQGNKKDADSSGAEAALPASGESASETVAEEWLPVVGSERFYEVSNHGRVRSLTRVDGNGHLRNGKIFTPSIGSHGYRMVSVRGSCGRFIKRCVSRLVADGRKQNDRASNLEWVTSSENKLHAYATGLRKPNDSATCWTAKLTPATAEIVRQQRREGVFARVLAARFGVSLSAIYCISKGRTWKA